MKLRVIRVGLSLAGSALGLALAAALLDGMKIDGLAFVVAVLIFTVLTVILDPLLGTIAEKYVQVLEGGTALIATALSLVLTAWISDGLSIDGVGTWLMATVIVWLGSLLIGVLLAKLVLDRMKPG